jgi:hypothetical protein
MTALPQTTQSSPLGPLRLALTAKPVNTDRLDGAWWPYGTDVTVELPPLLEAIGKRFGRTRAVMLNPEAWMAAPQWLLWGSWRARIGWYQHQDPNTAILLGENDKRIDLLVIPPNTQPNHARSAADLASTGGNTLTASDTLQTARERLLGGAAEDR